MKQLLIISNPGTDNQTMFDAKIRRRKDRRNISIEDSVLDTQVNYVEKTVLLDTGNGYEITINGKCISMDYSEAERVLLALRTANLDDYYPSKYKIMEIKKVGRK